MAATVRGVQGYSGSAPGFTVAAADGAPVDGDLRLISLTCNPSAAPSIDAGAGWTSLLAFTPTSATSAVYLWSRVFAAGDPATTVSFAGAVYGAQVVSIAGADTAAPLVTSTAPASSSSGTTLTTASLTPTAANSLLLAYFAMTAASGSSTNTMTTPTGMTLVDFTFRNSTQGHNILLASQPLTTTAATGTRTSTSNVSGQWEAVAVAVSPAATAAPTAGNFFRYLGGMNGGFAR
jgi:hypothetical protein